MAGGERVASDTGKTGPTVQERYLAEARERIDWYQTRVGRARKAIGVLTSAKVLLAAAIPALSTADVYPWIIPALGSAVLVAEGAEKLGRFQQNRVRWITTMLALRKELRLFETRVEPYSDRQAFEIFVQRFERLEEQETEAWAAEISRNIGPSAPKNPEQI